jgi:hypothetical protein
MNDDQEALKVLLLGYFHQDWDLDEASPDDVLKRYFRDHDEIEVLSSVLRALREVIDRDDFEVAFSMRFLEEIGCSFHPPGIGLSAHDWLQTLADEFEREIKTRA